MINRKNKLKEKYQSRCHKSHKKCTNCVFHIINLSNVDKRHEIICEINHYQFSREYDKKIAAICEYYTTINDIIQKNKEE